MSFWHDNSDLAGNPRAAARHHKRAALTASYDEGWLPGRKQNRSKIAGYLSVWALPESGWGGKKVSAKDNVIIAYASGANT